MRKKSLLTLLVLSAVIITFCFNEANAALSLQVGTPNLSFSLSDYQPAPPNVRIHNDEGRPYYVERDRRVYMEKKHHDKRHKKEKKDHNNNGRHDGYDKHDRH